MSIIHAPRKPELELGPLTFLIGLGLAMASLFLRLWYLQVVQSDELTERALAFQETSVSKLAPRGLIYDRAGRPLASVKPEIVVTAEPGIVKKNEWVLDKLAEMLSVPVKKLKDKVQDALWRPFLATPIYVGAPIEVATRIAEGAQDLPGIGVETQPMRVYADSVNFSHVLGYVWTPSQKDVKRLEDLGLKTPDYVGKIGLEYSYERFLMGQVGNESVETDAKKRPLRVIGRENAVPGDKLTLTLDADLQSYVQALLKEKFDQLGAPGAAVAIEPSTGEILCLVSTPSYDTSLFTKGISQEDWDQLLQNPSHPLTNRALGGVYAPGSTFKIVTALAAEEAGTFDPSRYNFCPGYYEVGKKKFKCLGHHGSIQFHTAFTQSCNTYFSDLGVRTGREAIVKAALEMGIGRRSGIDLLGESRGIVPTDPWLKAVQKLKDGEAPRWYIGNTVNISIGQGDIGATPLQMADMAAMVANEGVLYKPHLVRSRTIFGPKLTNVDTPIEELSRVNVPTEFWSQLKSAMVSVIESGTAKSARVNGLAWGGKTGSSEHNLKGTKTHSWFVGVAPMDHPRIAIAVVVESAGHGGEVAAPIAAAAVRHYLFKHQDPAAAAKTPNAVSTSAASRVAPDVR